VQAGKIILIFPILSPGGDFLRRFLVVQKAAKEKFTKK